MAKLKSFKQVSLWLYYNYFTYLWIFFSNYLVGQEAIADCIQGVLHASSPDIAFISLWENFWAVYSTI